MIFKTESLISELKKIEGIEIHTDVEDNKVTFKDIKIPNKASKNLTVQTVKTILSRRGVDFTESISVGLKQELEKAGAIVDVIEWNTALGSDVNEVLKSGNIAQIA